MLYYTILHYTILYCTILYYTILDTTNDVPLTNSIVNPEASLTLGICGFVALPPGPVELPVDCLDKQPFEGPKVAADEVTSSPAFRVLKKAGNTI